jgi:DNA-binding PadR family transcriptional regulator
MDLLLLKTLSVESMHGYSIALRIRQISKVDFEIEEGTLYPLCFGCS